MRSPVSVQLSVTRAVGAAGPHERNTFEEGPMRKILAALALAVTLAGCGTAHRAAGCVQPSEPAGTAIQVNGYGNAIIAPSLDVANYVCAASAAGFGWVKTSVPVR
jgi:hypothetical protein